MPGLSSLPADRRPHDFDEMPQVSVSYLGNVIGEPELILALVNKTFISPSFSEAVGQAVHQSIRRWTAPLLQKGHDGALSRRAGLLTRLGRIILMTCILTGVHQVVGVEVGDSITRASGPLRSAGQLREAAEPARFRVVHTSGETIVGSEAEAQALLSKLPGARVFRQEPVRH
jgi:hypothetical protein